MGLIGNDRGQALPVVAMVMLVAVLTIVLTTRIGVAVTDRARARTAADAAALAGVMGGRPAAEEISVENGAVLEAFVRQNQQVEVTVRFGTRRATSRARLDVITP